MTLPFDPNAEIILIHSMAVTLDRLLEEFAKKPDITADEIMIIMRFISDEAKKEVEEKKEALCQASSKSQ